LKENLGPGFEDLDVSDLTPKNLAKKVIGNAMDDVKPVISDVKRQSKEIKDVAKIDPDLL
jgi:sec-independent protein translocase protein TatB